MRELYEEADRKQVTIMIDLLRRLKPNNGLSIGVLSRVTIMIDLLRRLKLGDCDLKFDAENVRSQL